MLRLPPSKAETAATILALAAGAALLELALGSITLGNRAEALSFLLVRPWIVLLLALTMDSLKLGVNATIRTYACFLLLAGGSESILMLRLGNPDPWGEMLLGWATLPALAIIAEVTLAVAVRRLRWVAAAALAILFLAPIVRGGYESLLVAPPPAPAEAKPDVTLMTSLPLVWGEGGAFDPGSRPASIYTALQREFALHPIDALDAPSLGKGRVLLLIQPRWLDPEELVALDAWVRSGGRALVLTDPALDWPSELPLGDIRRPPPVGLLKPLLDHWGLRLAAGQPAIAGPFDRARWLALEHAGRLTPTGPACRASRAYLAGCVIGAGQAVILADADLVRDALWLGAGANGAAPHRRVSDNPLVIADLLDRLAGLDRPRALGDARWQNGPVPPAFAFLVVVLPLAGLALGAGAALHLLRRRGRR